MRLACWFWRLAETSFPQRQQSQRTNLTRKFAIARRNRQHARRVRYPDELGVFQDFFDCRIASENAAQSILPQRDHAELDRFLLQDHGGRALVD